MSTREPPLDEEGVEPLAERIRDLPRVGDRAAGRHILIWIAGAAALAFIALLVSGALGSETFRKLTGKEIAARLTGMELTDDVHWGLVFERGGHLSPRSRWARRPRGTWRVQQDELCSDTGRGEQCQQVWVSGKNVQLRKPGLDIFEEGVLQKPHARKLP